MPKNRLSPKKLDLLKLEVAERDGYNCKICEFLDCPSWASSPHHIIYRSEQGKDEANNLISICPEHHHDIHHGSLKKLLQGILRGMIK